MLPNVWDKKDTDLAFRCRLDGLVDTSKALLVNTIKSPNHAGTIAKMLEWIGLSLLPLPSVCFLF